MKTYERIHVINRFPCNDQICIYILYLQLDALCDFAVSIQHKFHQNGKHFSVFKAMSDWIRKNSHSTSTEQSLDLFDAIAKDKIQGIQPDHYFINAQIRYYWQKGVASAQYISQDLCENIEHVVYNTKGVNFADRNDWNHRWPVLSSRQGCGNIFTASCMTCIWLCSHRCMRFISILHITLLR